MSKPKVAPARPTKQAPRVRTLKTFHPAPATPESAGSLESLADDASAIAGLVDVVQEQIEEYESLLHDIVEKVTGRSLWAPCALADAGGDHQTLNRKNGAVHYLLIMMGEKATALEMQARALQKPAAAA